MLAAVFYAAVRRDLRKVGTPIPANDAWIAAICRRHALPLISRDRHFDAVPRLARQNLLVIRYDRGRRLLQRSARIGLGAVGVSPK